MMGGITLDSVKVVQDKPGVERDASGQPLVTQEGVGIVPIQRISTGTDEPYSEVEYRTQGGTGAMGGIAGHS
jgi:hypothetical protein